MSVTGEKSFAEKWLNLHDWVEWFAQFGVPRPISLGTLFLGFLAILAMEIPHIFVFGLGWLGGTAPIWLPVVLVRASWESWVRYVRSAFLSTTEPVLLEIKLPREITKSPRAMEIALNTLWQTGGETTFINRAWRGRVRVWYSFEIASFGGDVHFYVWTWESYRNVVEAALYAQFPEIEIHIAEDYASKLQYDPNIHDGFVNDYKLSKSNVYPIKSYIDFELDKDPKEEFKVEPLAQMFEYLSSLRPHEQVWIQIMIRANHKSGGVLFPTNDSDTLKTLLQKEIKNIRLESVPEEERANQFKFPNPTWRQRMQAEIIERHSGKLHFDVCARAVYLIDSRKGSVVGSNIGILRFIWKPLGNPGYLNEFNPDNSGGHNTINYPWQDFKGLHRQSIMRQFLDAYRRRSSFYPPWTAAISTMSVESIATLWHFPGSSVAAPGINRIPATKASPPPNLPK